MDLRSLLSEARVLPRAPHFLHPGWALERAGGELCAMPVLVERKRIGDLVGRSAAGDHIEQLRRMGGSA